MEYDLPLTFRESALFTAWFEALRDDRARIRIQWRLRRLGLGLAGDVRPVAHGVSELRIDYGPGYRVYFVRRGGHTILLVGGHKGTQVRDIATALHIAKTWKD